ncbi:hypothetical protein GCK32_017234, partial [Trichostrongylus colubriformis]
KPGFSSSGPTLRILNNPKLERILIPSLNFGKQQKPIVVSIRGNPKLDQDALDVWSDKISSDSKLDLQEVGECGLPKEFTSFDDIKGCSSVYGPLVINSKSPARFSTDGVGNFNYTGCIQIKNSSLEDYTFLEKFKNFVPIAECNQYIIGNKNLCIEKFDMFLTVFKGIKVYDNKNSCEKNCLGGEATNEFLKRISKCKTVHGDLHITGWMYKPRYIKSLQSIEEITGKLYIVNNIGISELNEFSSLKYVGNKSSELYIKNF